MTGTTDLHQAGVVLHTELAVVSSQLERRSSSTNTDIFSRFLGCCPYTPEYLCSTQHSAVPSPREVCRKENLPGLGVQLSHHICLVISSLVPGHMWSEETVDAVFLCGHCGSSLRVICFDLSPYLVGHLLEKYQE